MPLLQVVLPTTSRLMIAVDGLDEVYHQRLQEPFLRGQSQVGRSLQ